MLLDVGNDYSGEALPNHAGQYLSRLHGNQRLDHKQVVRATRALEELARRTQHTAVNVIGTGH